MLHSKLNTALFLGLCILFTACFSYKNFLKSEQAMLKRVATSDIAGTQKIDSLLSSSVRLMQAALKPINPVKGGKLIQHYYNQNDVALKQIMGDMNTDFANLNTGQQAIYTVQLARRPYAKEFIKLYPKFRRKYKTVKAASKFLGFMGKGLGKFDFLLK